VRGAQDFISNGTTASWDDSSSAEQQLDAALRLAQSNASDELTPMLQAVAEAKAQYDQGLQALKAARVQRADAVHRLRDETAPASLRDIAAMGTLPKQPVTLDLRPSPTPCNRSFRQRRSR
jgi:hypothetical protein